MRIAANSCFAVSVTQDIQSAQGIPLDPPLSTSFTTGASPDTIAPTVNVNPQNGATNVPRNTVIVFAFSEPMSPVALNASTLRVSNGGTPVAGSITLAQENRLATFRPSSSFLANSMVDQVAPLRCAT